MIKSKYVIQVYVFCSILLCNPESQFVEYVQGCDENMSGCQHALPTYGASIYIEKLFTILTYYT